MKSFGPCLTLLLLVMISDPTRAAEGIAEARRLASEAQKRHRDSLKAHARERLRYERGQRPTAPEPPRPDFAAAAKAYEAVIAGTETPGARVELAALYRSMGQFREVIRVL